MGPRRLLAALTIVGLLVSGVDLAGAGAQEPAAEAVTEPRPDGQVRRARDRTFRGNGVYNSTGVRQGRTALVQPGGQASFSVRIQNDASVTDDLVVSGSASTDRFTVRYLLAGQPVTAEVTAGRLRLDAVPPGGERLLEVKVRPTARARRGELRRTVVRTTSTVDPTSVDAVRANVRVPLYSTEQERIADLVNGTRRGAGLRGLAMHRTLAAKAQSWAEYLARINRLAHSSLTAGVPSGWRALGENVGYGSTVTMVHRAFLGSSGHRRNVLGHWTHLGTGYAARSGRVFVVHVFMRS